MARIKRKDERIYRASVCDGRGIGRVYVEDGYGRLVEVEGYRYGWVEVVGVHTEAEAVTAAKVEYPEFFEAARREVRS